jgi:hypothetical protein
MDTTVTVIGWSRVARLVALASPMIVLVSYIIA